MRRNLVVTIVVVVGMLAATVALLGTRNDSGRADAEAVVASVPSSTTTTTDPGPTAAEVAAWNEAVDLHTWNTAVWIHRTNEATWVDRTNARLAAEAAARAEAEREAAERAEAQRREREAAATTTTQAPATTTTEAPAAGPVRSGACGGDLPPCYVLNRESGGDPRIWNGGCYAPVGWRGSSPCGSSSASGLWQFVRGTWGGFGGYVNAADAPVSVQNERARQLWAGGAGCGHWNAC